MGAGTIVDSDGPIWFARRAYTIGTSENFDRFIDPFSFRKELQKLPVDSRFSLPSSLEGNTSHILDRFSRHKCLGGCDTSNRWAGRRAWRIVSTTGSIWNADVQMVDIMLPIRCVYLSQIAYVASTPIPGFGPDPLI